MFQLVVDYFVAQVSRFALPTPMNQLAVDFSTALAFICALRILLIQLTMDRSGVQVLLYAPPTHLSQLAAIIWPS